VQLTIPWRSGGREPSGDRRGGGSGAQRQAADRPDAWQDRRLPEYLGRPDTLLADNGYFSEANVMLCETANIEPLIALGRQPHHQSLWERFVAAPPAPENPTPVEAMAYRLRTPQGKKLYALRKQTPEPVFGIIKSVMGFRQFLLRGLENVRGEWSLVTMAWNIKRMFALSPG
jgi:hypothetical protein